MASKKSAKKSASTKPSKKAGKSMDELLAMYEANPLGLSLGDRVKGKIISIEKNKVIIDIGGKSEGLVAEKAYKEAEKYIRTLNEGDEIEAMVLVPETTDGYTILSLRQAAEESAWTKIKQAKKNKSHVPVRGKITNSAGVMVDVFGLTGFIPNSQLGKDFLRDKNSLVDMVFKAVVIDLSRKENKIVLSEKEVSEAEDLAMARDAIKKIKEGEVYDGEVTTIYDFGCFVKIEFVSKSKEKIPLEGLVHISEMSWGKVANPKDVLSEGDKVKVKVLDKSDGKLAFSIKQVQKDPWDEAAGKYKKDKEVEGKIVKVSDFGVFVELEPGVEGLIHITKIPPGKKYNKGDELNVYIEEIDAKEKKLSLGIVLTAKPVGYK